MGDGDDPLRLLLDVAATIFAALGQLADDVTIVGGLAPGLLVPRPPVHVDPHGPTADIDFGLSIAIDAENIDSFTSMAEMLRGLGFAPKNAASPSRWASRDQIVLDFLCGVPLGYQEKNLVPVTDDFAAVAFPATALASIDRDKVAIVKSDGEIIDVWVCGLGSFIALKVDALRARQHPRDAYDIIWILRAWEGGPAGAAQTISESPLVDDPSWTGRADVLESLFGKTDALGSQKYGDYFSDETNVGRALEAVTTVREFRSALQAP